MKLADYTFDRIYDGKPTAEVKVRGANFSVSVIFDAGICML